MTWLAASFNDPVLVPVFVAILLGSGLLWGLLVWHFYVKQFLRPGRP